VLAVAPESIAVPEPQAPTPASGSSNPLTAAAIVGAAVIAAAGILAFSWNRTPAAASPAPAPTRVAPHVEPAAAGKDTDLVVPALVDLMAARPASGDTAEGPALLSVEEVVTRTLPAVVKVEARDGFGTGFFVARDTLLTNAHVVGLDKAVTLRLSGGEQRTAGVEKVWREVDLAMLKIDIVDLNQIVLPVARPEEIRIGAEVVAIGSPLGLQNTVTRGIISGRREYVYDRIGGQSMNVVQTDAAINPGNSGGPLIDRYGRVVGVNTMKIGGPAEGLGFAVDMHYARRMLGPDFALKSAADQRREDGLREYERSVRFLAVRADETETRWKAIRGTCFIPPDGEPPALREWFRLADGPQGMLRNQPACVSWNPFIVDYAKRIREALQHYETLALNAGVKPETTRVIRRRYNLAWSAWEK
jgi:S1-C subfamily serine protease